MFLHEVHTAKSHQRSWEYKCRESWSVIWLGYLTVRTVWKWIKRGSRLIHNNDCFCVDINITWIWTHLQYQRKSESKIQGRVRVSQSHYKHDKFLLENFQDNDRLCSHMGSVGHDAEFVLSSGQGKFPFKGVICKNKTKQEKDFMLLFLLESYFL